MFRQTNLDSLMLAGLLLLVSTAVDSSAQDLVSPDISSRDAIAPASIAPLAIGSENHPLQATDGVPSIDEVFRFQKLTEVSLDIHSTSKRKPDSKFTEVPIQSVIEPAITVYMWESPAIHYHPLYFEDPTLERYGQDAGLLTPGVSGVHFFSRVLTLPFHAMVRPPLSAEYPLGYGRPGNNNAYLHYQFPW